MRLDMQSCAVRHHHSETEASSLINVHMRVSEREKREIADYIKNELCPAASVIHNSDSRSSSSGLNENARLILSLDVIVLVGESNATVLVKTLLLLLLPFRSKYLLL